MHPDRLYDLALAFRRAKLWNRLRDSELFAVSFSNGQTGYCCVMGALSKQIALAVYLGDRGLDSYRLLQEVSRVPANPLKVQEYLLSQFCLQCAFESKDILNPRELASLRSYGKTRGITFRGANAFPQFVKYQPARCPWEVLEPGDIQMLCEALAAALAVSERLTEENKYRLGFTAGFACDRPIPLLTVTERGFDWGICQLPTRRPASYPAPTLKDELLTMRLKKRKNRLGTWICDVVMFPQPTRADEDYPDSPPIFPYTLLAADVETGMIIPAEIVFSYENSAEKLLSALGYWMLDNGIPAEIYVVDERTRALLADLASVLGIRLVRQPENELLDSLETSLMDFCEEQMEAPNMIAEAVDDISEMVMALDDDELLSMPDILQKQFLAMERQGLFPEDVAKRVRSLF